MGGEEEWFVEEWGKYVCAHVRRDKRNFIFKDTQVPLCGDSK